VTVYSAIASSLHLPDACLHRICECRMTGRYARNEHPITRYGDPPDAPVL
jgi:hypothetical protein